MASRKPSSRKKKKTPATRRKKKVVYQVLSHNKRGVTFRPQTELSRKKAVDGNTFLSALTKLGAMTVARIVGVSTNTAKSWQRDPTKIPKTAAKYDVELALTMRRYDYMTRRAAKVQNVSREGRAVYFDEYLKLASKERPTHRENSRIVTILLKLGIDPHRPESYLRGAT